MKNKFLLLALASFSLIAANGASAGSLANTDPIELEEFVVEASRHLPLEEAIQASLDDLRCLAHPPAIDLELPEKLGGAAVITMNRDSLQLPTAKVNFAKM